MLIKVCSPYHSLIVYTDKTNDELDSTALPYLIRRANENQSILKSDPTSGRGGAQGERKAVGKEFRRRMGIPF